MSILSDNKLIFLCSIVGFWTELFESSILIDFFLDDLNPKIKTNNVPAIKNKHRYIMDCHGKPIFLTNKLDRIIPMPIPTAAPLLINAVATLLFSSGIFSEVIEYAAP